MKLGLFNAVAAGIAILFPIIGGGGLSQKEELSREAILATSPEWQQKYESFEPEADMIEALRTKIKADVKFEVYLGVWCPDSRNNVPPFIKILDRLGTGVPTRYIGVPRKKSKDIQYYVEELKVERVPTFIFYRDGSEIGRIVENPKNGMMEDCMEIFFR